MNRITWLLVVLIGLNCAHARTTQDIADDCRDMVSRDMQEDAILFDNAVEICMERETGLEIARSKAAARTGSQGVSLGMAASVMAQSIGSALSRNAARGLNPSPAYGQPRSGGCVSDNACGWGNICVKPTGQFYGYCAQAVDRYGVPVYQPNRPSSIMPGQRHCQTTMDCPVGFDCSQGNCIRY